MCEVVREVLVWMRRVGDWLGLGLFEGIGLGVGVGGGL